MKEARARKRRGAQETTQTQDYPYTPPLRSRYSTRNSRGVVPQLLASSPRGSIAHNPSLKPALRILKNDGVTGMTELSNCSSQHDPVSVKDVKPSTSTGSPNPTICNPSNQHITNPDGLRAYLTSQVEGVAPQPASHQDVDGHFQPPRGDSVVPRGKHVLEKCKTHDGPSSSHCLSPSCSLNLTEFATGLQGDSDDDPDEVESAPCLDYEYVQGHKVKIEIARLVGAIFGRYGDITRESNVKSPSIISFFLERLCDVYQRLEKRKLFDLTRAEINDMLDELHFYQNQKLNVGWLLEKLEKISETKSSFKQYLMVKGEAAKCIESVGRIDKDLEQYHRHVALIQNKISAAEQEKKANEAKAKEYTKMAHDIKTKVKALANQSLVHGLL